MELREDIADLPRRFSVQTVNQTDGRVDGNPDIVRLRYPTENNTDVQNENFELYEAEFQTRPLVGNLLNKLAAYTGGIAPTAEESAKLKKRKNAQLGTLLGVYCPCLQNIFGVLLFIRLCWLVGCAGVLQALAIVGVCCLTTLMTALSMSAIATNGKVSSGGSYYMISRALGPEFGGAVGILFYLGTTVAAAMYIIGAVEIFLTYIYPDASLFGGITGLSNDTRVYGTILLFIMFACVCIGIRFVSKFATLSLICVLISIGSIYLGVIMTNSSNSPKVCVMGEIILDSAFVTGENGTNLCNKNISGPIYREYCADETDELCNLFHESEVGMVAAIPGILGGDFLRNFFSSHYAIAGQVYDYGPLKGNATRGMDAAIADITTSFAILLGIFFPSVTGIMAGSNRSGDLANPQKSIPRGTIGAIITTSTVYLTSVILFAACVDGRMMRDKFGHSLGGGLTVAHLAWPNPWVIQIGAFLSTLGAGLQSLTGAPRLLQAIAQDNVIPLLRCFKVVTKRGEPFRAQAITLFIAQLGILIASIDYITPLITMFFLMCYGFVNMATALNELLGEPGWRPRFKYCHWAISGLGLFLCITLMFVTSVLYALCATLLAVVIYKYIQYRGATKEWGDAVQGLQLASARNAILKLGWKPLHVKNWRPNILILLELDEQFQAKHTTLLNLCYQLRAGRGLTLLATVLKGELHDRQADVPKAEETLAGLIRTHKLKALPDVLVAKEELDGMVCLIQSAGLGALRPNTLLLSFPHGWREDGMQSRVQKFMDTIRACSLKNIALVIPKNIDQFPTMDSGLEGWIDTWWIVHDGGILMLLSHLLHSSPVYSRCKLRTFIAMDANTNTAELKKDLMKFLYELRIESQVEIVEFATSEISAYSVQKKNNVLARQQMLAELNMRTIAAGRDIQTVMDLHCTGVTVDDAVLPRPRAESSFYPNTIPEVTITGASPSGSLDFSRSADHISGSPAKEGIATGSDDDVGADTDLTEQYRNVNEFTFTTRSLPRLQESPSGQERRNRIMHSAANINEMMRMWSHDADMVLVNLPALSSNATMEGNIGYMEYVETLVAGLKRVMLVRGTGREVITVYNE